MKIWINGEETVTHSITLDSLLAELGHEPTSVATAVNLVFVPRHQRGQHTLNDNDSIDIIAPMSGG